MINVFCDKCKYIPNSQIQIRTEGERKSIVIECLTCGDMKRLKDGYNGML